MAKNFSLPKEQYTELLQAERQLHDSLSDIESAEECGIECSELRSLRDEYLQRIEAIKKNYAPKGQIR